MIKSFIFAAALATMPSQVQAQMPRAEADPTLSDARSVLTVEDNAVIRCTAAFGLVAAAQERGDVEAQKWPALGDRGKEFFVQALVGVMDRHGFDRFTIGALVRSEAESLYAEANVNAVIPGCLLMLEASGIE